MEPLKFEIDGAALRQYLKDTGRSMQALSKEIGCGSGYMSNATLTNRMGKPQYLYMCHILGVDVKRIEKDIVRLGQVALDIRELLKGEPK